MDSHAAPYCLHLHAGYAPDLWLEWTQDEIALAKTAEDRRRLITLFERAVSEYLCTTRPGNTG